MTKTKKVGAVGEETETSPRGLMVERLPVDQTGSLFLSLAAELFARVRNPPHRITDIVGDKQAAVFCLGQSDRATHDACRCLAGCPEPEREIVIAARGPAILERHIDNLVAARSRCIP